MANLAWEMGFTRVPLEGDAKAVYGSILDSSEDLSHNGSVLGDLYLYASWFNCFDCGYVPRTYNSPADCLANMAISGGSEVWLENPPDDIVALLLADVDDFKIEMYIDQMIKLPWLWEFTFLIIINYNYIVIIVIIFLLTTSSDKMHFF